MEKFTKGPWKLDRYGNIVQTNGRDARDCIRAGGLALTQNDGEPMYNRHLIAAAPEMYEMLQKAADELLFMIRKANSDMMQAITSTDESIPDYYNDQTVFEIMQLLAKARGEK